MNNYAVSRDDPNICDYFSATMARVAAAGKSAGNLILFININ